MLINFKTPTTLVIGEFENSIGILQIEGRNKNLQKIEVESPIKELLSKLTRLEFNDDIQGHIAITSFGYSTIKVVDIGSSSGTYALTKNCEITRIPTIRFSIEKVLEKDFSQWIHVESLPIFLNNIFSENESILLTTTRLGENLYINIAYIGSNTLKFLKTLLSKISRIEGCLKSATCISRIEHVPLELVLMKKGIQLVTRIYLNDAIQPFGNKFTMVISEGGNIIKKVSGKILDENLLNQAIELIEYFTSIF